MIMHFRWIIVLISIPCAIGCAAKSAVENTFFSVDRAVGLTTDYHPLGERSVEGRHPFIRFTGVEDSLLLELPYALELNEKNGVHLVNINTGETTPTDFGRSSIMSPSGQAVAYYNQNSDVVVQNLAERQQQAKIVHRNADPNEEFGLRAYFAGTGLSWDSSGEKLAYLARVTEHTHSKDPEDAQSNSTGTEIHVLDQSGNMQTMVYRSNGLIADVVWVPGKNQILIAEREDADPEYDNFDASLYDVRAIDLDTNAIVEVVANVATFGGFVRLSPSPDGSKVAYFSEPHPIPPSFLGIEPAIASIDGASARPITDRTFMAGYPGESMIWSSDSQRVFYRCKSGALFNDVCVTNIDTNETSFLSFDDTEDILAFDIDFVSGKLARITRDAYDIIRVSISNLDGRSSKLFHQIARVDLAEVSLGEVRSIKWNSFDGLELGGLLILPIGYQEGKRYPLIVDVHGGPFGGVRLHGSLGVASPLEWQVWASKGYAVFVTDYRLGAAYGTREEHIRRPLGESLLDINTDDILSGVRHLIEVGIADPDNLAIIGHSYGAIYTNWIVTKTNMFRAAVSKEGSADSRKHREYCIQRPGCMWHKRATAENIDRILSDESAVLRADQVSTPILLISGGKGLGSEENDTMQAFAEAIVAAGGTARRLHFESEGHVFKDPENIRTTYEESIQWIESHFDE